MAFVGDLRDFALPEILQVLVHGKRTGEVELRCSVDHTDIEGMIVIARGRVIHAEQVGAESALEAFWGLIALKEGHFAFESVEFTAITSPVTIDRTLDSLLLESLSDAPQAS
ncbi:MAG: DUF4388 domain-containing protein [Actinobacteria bacterium]|nr:DUF4388 domain-containing protein [Actinomycetota bacterium]